VVYFFVYMQRLKIYNIDDDYIRYLSQYDSNIDYNVKNNSKHKRPYIGIIMKIFDSYYFAPLKSPKKKFCETMKNHIDIILIENGKKGVINLNDMIPISKEHLGLLKEVDYIIKQTDNEDEIKYKNIIQDQTAWCNKLDNKAMIIKKATKLYSLYNKLPKDNKLRQRCCNFKLLEEKAKEYKNFTRSINSFYFS